MQVLALFYYLIMGLSMKVQDLKITSMQRDWENTIADCIIDYAEAKHHPQNWASHTVEQEFCRVVDAICDAAGYNDEAGRQLICGSFLADALSKKGEVKYVYEPTDLNYEFGFDYKKTSDSKYAEDAYYDALLTLDAHLVNVDLVDELASRDIDLGSKFESYRAYLHVKTYYWGMNYFPG